MKVIKIDPVQKTVEEIELQKNPNDTLDECYSIIGCEYVEIPSLGGGCVAIIDEEGRLKENHAILFENGLILAGVVLIAHSDGEDLIDHDVDIERLKKAFTWLEPKDVPAPVTTIYSF